ncbi:MAG: transglutaminase domain-containing protein [Dehalococcoidia bacterium]
MAFNRQKYLVASELCDFDSSIAIKLTAQDLVANCRSRKERFQRIFDFVKELPYGLDDWDLKASETLRKGWGMCSGKTNLLIAMLRSIGIPARYRIYGIKAEAVLWNQLGKLEGKAQRLKELGEERDHVDCEVWLGRWTDCDPGRDTAMERGIIKLGGTLERRKIINSRGKVRYLRLAVFDQWTKARQVRRKFRSDRTEIFTEINKGFQELRKLGLQG